jgi:hypothetical protein
MEGHGGHSIHEIYKIPSRMACNQNGGKSHTEESPAVKPSQQKSGSKTQEKTGRQCEKGFCCLTCHPGLEKLNPKSQHVGGNAFRMLRLHVGCTAIVETTGFNKMTNTATRQ